jgi:hypothetical protein
MCGGTIRKEKDMKTKTEFVIQRFVHRSFGTHESHWSDTSPDSFKIDMDLCREFTRNKISEDLAIKVVVALSKARPAEQFRAVERTIITKDDIGLQIGPRKPFTTDDLRELAHNPDHNGVPTFNGTEDAIIEANLDPCHFGSLAPKLVIHAVDTKDDPVDEWILVHHHSYCAWKGYESWSVRRIWWNLKQRATIVSDDDFSKAYFKRHDYGKGEYYDYGVRFKTFKGAVSRDTRQLGTVSKEEIVKRFPKTKEL